MKIERIYISPKKAKEMLEINKKNRTYKPHTLRRYKVDMLEGRWLEDTGELIKIGKSGTLLDGQHRLRAMVETDKGFYFHVGSQIDDAVMPMLDTGAPRTAIDAYVMSEMHYSNDLPSIINLYCSIKNGLMRTSRNRLTNKESLEIVLGRRLFWESVGSKSANWYKSFSKILSKTVIGALFAVFSDISPKDAESFFVELCTGVNVTNDTIRILRKKLNDDKISNKKMLPTYKNAIIIKAWNAYRKGVSLKVIKFDSSTEDFPVAI